jgi:hypothetical protein
MTTNNVVNNTLQLAADTFFGNNTGSLANGTALTVSQAITLLNTGVVIVPAASSFAGWDSSKNFTANSFLSGYATTATAASSTTLTVASAYQQFFTGTTTQTVVLPVASTLVLGQSFLIVNNSTGVVTVNSSGSNLVQTMAANTSAIITCILASGTSAASWNVVYYFNGGGSGTVSSGLSNYLAYYAATGTTVSQLNLGQGLAIVSTVLDVGGANNIPFNNGKGFQDNNGNSLLSFTVTASAVNYIDITNNATGSSPTLSALGSDSNIILTLLGKGTGGVALLGTSTNDSASSGYVGQLISSVVTSGSLVSLTNATAANITSISLPAGDYDVYGNVYIQNQAASVIFSGFAWVSLTSATQPDISLINGIGVTCTQVGVQTQTLRVSLSSTTTVYLSCISVFSTATSACGGIYARRRR